MARPANPNKEKIVAVKAEMKEHSKLVKQGESAAKKLAKAAERLAKLTGDAPATAPVKAAKGKAAKAEAAPVKKGKTAKVNAAEEKKKTKVVVNKKRGRPAKAAAEDDED